MQAVRSGGHINKPTWVLGDLYRYTHYTGPTYTSAISAIYPLYNPPPEELHTHQTAVFSHGPKRQQCEVEEGSGAQTKSWFIDGRILDSWRTIYSCLLRALRPFQASFSADPSSSDNLTFSPFYQSLRTQDTPTSRDGILVPNKPRPAVCPPSQL